MDDVLRVRVLGAAELVLGDRSLVQVMPVKAAAMVFHLALVGAPRSRSELAGLLWSDLPEDTARANLRLALTRLRRVLPDQVTVTRHQVGLTTHLPVWVDAAETRAASTGDLAPHELLAAVRLCGGELLAGFTVPGASLFDEWLTGRRAAVRAEMLAIMDRALRDARERRDAPTGVEVARRLVGLEPLHEEAHRALMWFLALDDRRGAAVAQFETCRYLLREELGAAPSPATMALRDEIVGGGGFSTLPRTPAGADGPARSLHGAAAPSGGSPPPHPPRPLTALIGREREQARLDELVRDPVCRLVTLVGPGGIGKTRLAAEAAAVDRPEHPDGAVFVSYVGTEAARPEDAADVLVTGLARALGIPMTVPRDPLDLVADHLGDRRLLLVLDNLEHVREGARVISALLHRVPGLTVMATSRRPLGLGPEWLVEVPGLAYPPPGADRDAAGFAAVELFHQRAVLLRPGYRTDAGDEGVARICRLVAGMPLAIELAARWVRSAGPVAIADRLAEGVELLETTSPDVEPRHRSLRSVIDWSYGLLTDEERAAFRRLSVLRRGFDLAAAEAVAGADLPMLAALVDQSVLTAGEDGRYEMHELLRQYAAARLAEDASAEALARRRHAEHYAARLAVLDATTSDGPTLPGVDPENVRVASEWFAAAAGPAELDAHLGHLWSCYRRHGWFRAAQAALVAALGRDDVTTLQRARWHRMLGEAHQQLGEAQPARDQLETALRLLGRRIPRSTRGWVGAVAAQAVRASLPAAPPGAVVDRDARTQAAHERASAAFTVNEVYWVLEDHRSILPSALASLADARRAADVDLLSWAHAGVGMTAGTLGLRRFARRQMSASRAAARTSKDPVTACWLAILGGLHATGVGDWAAVEAGADRARELGRHTSTHRLGDQVLLVAGVARYLAGRYPEAAASAATAMTSGRERRDPVVQFWGLVLLVETALRTSPTDPALELWSAEATRLLPQVARVDAARLHAAAARTHLAAGRPAQAWEAVRAVDRLLGPRPSFEQYALEAHAAVPEVCLALMEVPSLVEALSPMEVDDDGPGRADDLGGGPPDALQLRAVASRGGQRLRGYARTFPMARPRAFLCAGRLAWTDGRARSARRAWGRAVVEAERLRMPYDLARAHEELGRHLQPGQLSPLRLDRAGHLERALAGFHRAGCTADAERIGLLPDGP